MCMKSLHSRLCEVLGGAMQGKCKGLEAGGESATVWRIDHSRASGECKRRANSTALRSAPNHDIVN